MGLKNVIYNIATYSLVFSAGYYLAGGCDSQDLKERRSTSQQRIEQRLENYESRLENLESKLLENRKK